MVRDARPQTQWRMELQSGEDDAEPRRKWAPGAPRNQSFVQSQGGGKTSTHFNAESQTGELLFPPIVSVGDLTWAPLLACWRVHRFRRVEVRRVKVGVARWRRKARGIR